MARMAVILGSGATAAADDISRAGGGEALAIPRHGAGDHVLPHLLDHAANLAAVRDAGCDRVLAIASVGSLNQEIAVGAAVCPDDFIALQMPPSPFDAWRGHQTPGFDLDWREQVVSGWRSAAGDVRDGGVYWQTTGPRFETPAEIRLMAPHADVVGMTVASECVVAAELGIPYAAVCIVDNLANGIGKVLEVEELEENRVANAERLRASIGAVAAELVA